MTEKRLLLEILRTLGTRPELRIWRANVGVARIGRRVVRFGVPGQADITGILPNGRRLEIEVKAPDGRQTEDQANFQRMIERFCGLYVLARSVEDVRKAIEHAC
jgi:hypothetical protein